MGLLVLCLSNGRQLLAAGGDCKSGLLAARPDTTKKPSDISPTVILSLFVIATDYSATVLSTGAAALSATALSTTAVSTASTAVVSTGAALLVLLPQDAKEIAATATNINTNFFIFFAFLVCKTIICLLKRCKGIHFFDRLYFFMALFYALFCNFYVSR